MKTLDIFKILALLFFAFDIQSQIIINASTLPAAGDTFKVSRATLLGAIVSTPGANQIWDLSTANLSPVQRETYYLNASTGYFKSKYSGTSLVAKANPSDSVETYFILSSNGVYNAGIAAKDPLGLNIQVYTRYLPPILSRRANLQYLDQFTQTTSLLAPIAASDLPDTLLSVFPIRPDSIRLRNNIVDDFLVDSWGRVKTPESKEYDVLRVKLRQISDQKFEAKFGFLGWQDITSLIPAGSFGIGNDTLVTYYFYNNLVKEPICTMTTDSTFNNIVSLTFKTHKPIVLSTEQHRPQILEISLYPNPSVSRIFANSTQELSKFQIFNSIGNLIEQGFYSREGVEVDKLIPGIYWMRLEDFNGKQWLGKFYKN